MVAMYELVLKVLVLWLGLSVERNIFHLSNDKHQSLVVELKAKLPNKTFHRLEDRSHLMLDASFERFSKPAILVDFSDREVNQTLGEFDLLTESVLMFKSYENCTYLDHNRKLNPQDVPENLTLLIELCQFFEESGQLQLKIITDFAQLILLDRQELINNSENLTILTSYIYQFFSNSFCSHAVQIPIHNLDNSTFFKHCQCPIETDRMRIVMDSCQVEKRKPDNNRAVYDLLFLTSWTVISAITFIYLLATCFISIDDLTSHILMIITVFLCGFLAVPLQGNLPQAFHCFIYVWLEPFILMFLYNSKLPICSARVLFSSRSMKLDIMKYLVSILVAVYMIWDNINSEKLDASGSRAKVCQPDKKRIYALQFIAHITLFAVRLWESNITCNKWWSAIISLIFSVPDLLFNGGFHNRSELIKFHTKLALSCLIDIDLMKNLSASVYQRITDWQTNKDSSPRAETCSEVELSPTEVLAKTNQLSIDLCNLRRDAGREVLI